MKKKINYQKIFAFISFIFIISCFMFYGIRFIRLYIGNQKKNTIETNTLAKNVKNNNIDNLKNVNNNYYFNGKDVNNFVLYSGIIWRIVKIYEDNSIMLISNKSLTSLAFGKNLEYKTSYINTWLNDSSLEYTGILEKNINQKENYLQKSDLCIDKVDSIKSVKCKDIVNDYYITLLSYDDYINTGASQGFINTEEYFYLANQNSELQSWYVDSEGKININEGNSIYGVKAVIKLKPNLNLSNGSGTQEDPYIIESNFGLFGSYVKLGDDIWKVMDANSDNSIRLVYNDFIKEDGTAVLQKYSNYSSYHDDTKYNTVAYYMNNIFLNKLSYKDLILERNYSNGYYGSDIDFDYKKTLQTTINTKVALLSVGDILLNDNLDNSFSSTSSSNSKNYIFSFQKDSTMYSTMISNKAYATPVITINRDILKYGIGTLDDPLRLEE